MDLRTATNCLETQRRYGTYDGARIGRIRRNCPGDFGAAYRAGQIVLFTEELEPTFASFGQQQKPRGTITIEAPLCQAEIERQKSEGSLITTIGSMVGVPANYVEEIFI